MYNNLLIAKIYIQSTTLIIPQEIRDRTIRGAD